MYRIPQLIRRNTLLKQQLKLIKIEIQQNKTNIQNLKKFKNVYEPLYFLYDNPKVSDVFLL